MTTENDDITPKVLSVSSLLAKANLRIPEYQRPYKWGHVQVLQLLQDIKLFQDKSAYRLGSVVLHSDNSDLNIVDGQQRTLTLLLIVQALIEERLKSIKSEVLKQQLSGLRSVKLMSANFPHQDSQHNLYRNY